MNEVRSIDVPLEAELVDIGPALHHDTGPSFEVAASLGSGFKNRNEKPLLVIVRIEAALRLGRRVNLGAFLDYGTIDTGDRCGFDMPGAIPTSDFDFGSRNQFTKCTYLMPGSQLYVHILPKSRIDPYLGLAPGFRFGFTEWTPYIAGIPQDPQSEIFPAVVVGVRAGVDYHPKPNFPGWEVGAYFAADITLIGDEQSSMNDGGGVSFVSYLGGARTSLQF